MGIILLLYLGIVLIDFIPLLKSRDKKSLLVYTPVLIVTLALNLLTEAGIALPDPSKPIKNLIEAIFGLR